MGDILLTLSVPALLLSSGLYAVLSARWRRIHPAPPSPYTRQAARLAGRAALTDAGRIVDEAYGTLGGLYDGRHPGTGAQQQPARAAAS
ncbi:hypothetical protein OG242_13370 [Streptomyces sp. NBC_00727]|uniref:hypothetical protein n=1 Tax=Streptomyces sp. NBC_00727 TaxID=2903675 RepID=UPI00386F1C92